MEKKKEKSNNKLLAYIEGMHLYNNIIPVIPRESKKNLLRSSKYSLAKDALKINEASLECTKILYSVRFTEDKLKRKLPFLSFRKFLLPFSSEKYIIIDLKKFTFNKDDINYFYVWKNRKSYKNILLEDGRMLENCRVYTLQNFKESLAIAIQYENIIYGIHTTAGGILNAQNTSQNIYFTSSTKGK